jgi:hypothetical protein
MSNPPSSTRPPFPPLYRWKSYLTFGVDWYRQIRGFSDLNFLPLQDPSLLEDADVPLIDATSSSRITFLRIALGKIYYGILHLVRQYFHIPPGRGIHRRVLDYLLHNYPRIGNLFYTFQQCRVWADYYDTVPLWKFFGISHASLYPNLNKKLGDLLHWMEQRHILT